MQQVSNNKGAPRPKAAAAALSGIFAAASRHRIEIAGATTLEKVPRLPMKMELAEQGRVELASRREHMPDDLTNKGPQDRSRISLLEPHEVQYWADKFNVSKERLSEAVKNVGHSVDAVERG